MKQKENITSNFIFTKVVAGLWIIFSIIQVYRNPNNILGLFDYFFLFGLPLLLLFFAVTRKKVEYDGENFYLKNWRGENHEVVPLEQLSSMLFAGFEGDWHFSIFSAYRFFYFSKEDLKKEFWLYPKFNFSIDQLQKKCKSANPNIMILNDTFLLAHLFFRNEDWFR